MKKLFCLFSLALCLSGCSTLIPKRVELGQDKVEKVPVPKSSERETQRQAAQRAALRADETYRAAIAEGSTPAVVLPAAETTVLSDAVSRSLGPPLSPASPNTQSTELARKLDTAVAKLNSRLDDFRDDNDKNAGHKIEGTGFLQVPYIVWLGGAAVLFMVVVVVVGLGWTALKAYSLSNPPVALGLKAVSLGGSLASKAVGQLVKGGEKFKERLQTEIPNLTEDARRQIEALFVNSHKESQDEVIQDAVKHLAQK